MPENNADHVDKETKGRNGRTKAVRTTGRTAAKAAPASAAAEAPEEAGKKKAENAEREIYEKSSLSNWEEKDLEALVTSFFPNVQIEYMSLQETRHLDGAVALSWWEHLDGAVALSWWEKTYSRYLDADEKDSFISALRERDVPFSSKVAIIKLIPEKMKAKVNDEAEKTWHEVQMKTQ